MYSKITFVLLSLALILFTSSCSTEDTSLPVINFESDSDAIVVPGQSTNITYNIKEDGGIKSHIFEIIDGTGSILLSQKNDLSSGAYTESYTIDACNYTPPIQARVKVEDNAGNINAEVYALNTKDVKVTFALEYGGEPLQYLTDYTYPTGQKFQFTRVSFFLSELGIGENNSDCVDFLNFGDISNNVVSAQKGITTSVAGIKDGDYNKIKASLGVSAALNDMTPADFPSDNPLSAAGEYWGSWKSYVFLKLEGKMDTDTLTEGYERPFGLHIGGNDGLDGLPINAKMDISIDTSIIINSDARNLRLVFDVEKVFNDNGEIYDIIETPGTHSIAKKAQILELAENASKAFSIK